MTCKNCIKAAECGDGPQQVLNELIKFENTNNKQLRLEISALKDKAQGLLKALEYCAQEPDRMHILQNMPHIVARNALKSYQEGGL